MSTALVTGHAGFLGREFTRQLRGQGWQVTGVDPRLGNLEAASDEAFAADCRDYFYAYPRQYDLIVHCAAVVGGRALIESQAAPLELAVNLELDAAMFRYAARTRAGRVLYLSSSAVYPVSLQEADARPLTESQASWQDPALPDELYGWAKLTGEMLAERCRSAGVPVTVVRPFSGYGTDQDPEYPFAAFIDRALARADPFIIWGSGAQVRDWIHVTDLVRSALSLAAARHPGPVNLAGTPMGMLALARRICDAAGYEPRFELNVSKPEGVRRRVADVSLMDKLCPQQQVSVGEGIAMALARRAAPAVVTVRPEGGVL